ncbi:GNAT family N-acetyltransferase [Sphingosinicella sp. BN140058]|uniref:GNAT family N-acetyltransferase n=1 Tax=Sphingosinicella sp. BN140058 TaxID=1892855 RepID=UPI0010115136|nr:GNAT family N-acetyltransferase [Sphingosinicella sp. BN140058]QAY75472.1 GNAT family N-acetyltransferase [Sphingosinicella sp. BN140058]
MSASVTLPFRIGARTLWRVRRRLNRIPLSLDQARRGELPTLPAEPGDGHLILSLPEACCDEMLARYRNFRPFIRQRYKRFYAALDVGFDAYLAGISAKSRSTLRRKLRKLVERSGGTLDLRAYRRPEEMAEFHRAARLVSERSYQERLLDAGLPDGPSALAEMKGLAARDQVRGWILHLDGQPIAYLYAPAEGTTLIYAYLGYDPDHADLSPGTVLQFEAMRQLMEEGRFRLFDFTEGEGQHKKLFSTGEVACLDLLLLRPTPANLMIGTALAGFDAFVASAKRVLRSSLLRRAVRR